MLGGLLSCLVRAHYTRLPVPIVLLYAQGGKDMIDSPSEFHDFEQAGWEKAASEYDRRFGELTAQSIAPSWTRSALHPALNCSTWHVARATWRRLQRAAVAPSWESTSPASMVDLASELDSELEFRFGDAEELDLPDNSMDAVVMNFGMLHLARPENAIAEAFRVLRPGGRYAFTVWDVPERAAAFSIILGSLQTHGNMDLGLPSGPPFFQFSDEEESQSALTSAGFISVRTLQVPQVWRVESGNEILTTFGPLPSGLRHCSMGRHPSGRKFARGSHCSRGDISSW